jgi:enoyl-CoA hydratase
MSQQGDDAPEVIVDRNPPIFTLTINRPAVRNALNAEVRRRLIEEFRAVRGDTDIRVVVLKGSGPDFCAGADINELAEQTAISASWPAERIDQSIELAGVPVVGVLRGNVLGGGFELSLACTLRVVSETFRGGLPEVRFGIIPGMGATQRLPRMVGEAVALDLILTGRTWDSSAAERLGYASRVVPDDQVELEAANLAESLAALSPTAIRSATEAVRMSFDLSRNDGLEHERRLFALLCGTADKEEGIRAWLEKRPALFTGN